MTEIPDPQQSLLARWYWIVPYVMISLLAAAMLAIVWWLYARIHDEHYQTSKHDVQMVEKTMRLRLQVTEVFLAQLAREMAVDRLGRSQFQSLTNQHIANSNGLASVLWLTPDETVRWRAPYDQAEPLIDDDALSAPQRESFYRARDLDRLTYGKPYENIQGHIVMKLFMPVRSESEGVFMGTFVGVFAVDRLVKQLLPHWFIDKYRFSLVDAAGNKLYISSGIIGGERSLSFERPFPLPGNNLKLRATTLQMPGLWLWMPAMAAAFLALLTLIGLWLLRVYVLYRARREKEQRRFFNLSLDILCTIGQDGIFRNCSPACLPILGYKPDQLNGRSFFDTIHSEDIPHVKEAVRRLKAGEPVSFENRCRCADGSFKWLMWNMNPVAEEDGFYVVAHDVTGRKVAEEALRAESSFRHAIEDSIMTGIIVFDLDGKIIFVNRAFCNLTGFDLHELVGQSAPYPYWPKGMEGDYYKRRELTMRGIMARNGFELRMQCKDGEFVDTLISVSPLIDNHNQQTGWIASINDMTESKRVRAALEMAHARFETVLDGLHASVHVAEMATDEILFANQTFRNIFGFNVVGRSVYAVGVPQAPFINMPENLAPEILPYKYFDGELQLPLSGRWFLVREHVTRWIDGRLVRMSIATDVTEKKLANDMARQQVETLQHTSRLMTMGEMASTLAHEINQPLSAIANYCMGCVMRLQSGNFRHEDLLTAMQKASVQAERASKIIHRVREFVRKNESDRGMVRLGDIIENTTDLVEIDAKRVNGRVVVDVPAALPTIYGNPILIEQVLLNLIKNAFDAMAHLPICDRVVTLRASILDARTVRISVIDNGHGIAEGKREQLFNLFYTTKPGGMGMGLNICRSIIESHNGRLTIGANPEGGSIFSFTLSTELDDEQVT